MKRNESIEKVLTREVVTAHVGQAVSDIRKTFAQRWIANAPGGWWYQDGGGNWKQK